MPLAFAHAAAGTLSRRARRSSSSRIVRFQAGHSTFHGSACAGRPVVAGQLCLQNSSPPAGRARYAPNRWVAPLSRKATRSPPWARQQIGRAELMGVAAVYDGHHCSFVQCFCALPVLARACIMCYIWCLRCCLVFVDPSIQSILFISSERKKRSAMPPGQSPVT